MPEKSIQKMSEGERRGEKRRKEREEKEREHGNRAQI